MHLNYKPLVAIQVVLPLEKVAVGTAINTFFQFLGGSVFLVIGQNIFQSTLIRALVANVRGEDPRVILRAGAEAARHVVAPENVPGLLEAYNDAITKTFVSFSKGYPSIYKSQKL